MDPPLPKAGFIIIAWSNTCLLSLKHPNRVKPWRLILSWLILSGCFSGQVSNSECQLTPAAHTTSLCIAASAAWDNMVTAVAHQPLPKFYGCLSTSVVRLTQAATCKMLHVRDCISRTAAVCCILRGLYAWWLESACDHTGPQCIRERQQAGADQLSAPGYQLVSLSLLPPSKTLGP